MHGPAPAIVVVLLEHEGAALTLPNARYNQGQLQSALQVAGCKPRTASKAAERVFRLLQQRVLLPHGQRLSLAGRVRLPRTPRQLESQQQHHQQQQQQQQESATAPVGLQNGSCGTGASVAGVQTPLHLQPQPHAPAATAVALSGAPAAHASNTGCLAAEVCLLRHEFEELVSNCLAAVDASTHVGMLGPGAAAAVADTAGGAPAAAAPTHSGSSTAAADSGCVVAAGSTAASSAAATGLDRQQQPSTAGRQGQLPPPLLPDFRTACGLREHTTSVTILLCGTSGTGKSTLASLLASRLGITTVVSTDSIRHMLRSFSSEAEDPLLWASTYEAGGLVARLGLAPGSAALTDPRKAAIKGYKAQSERIVAHLQRLIAACEARRQCLVVEGVHLSLSLVGQLMAQHASIVPFLVHISNEAKHLERFAVRAKAMTLRADGNRYVRHLRAIRAIQDYLCRSADKRGVPKVDNTNVDRSIATIHATVLGCLRRRAQGEALFDPVSGTCKPVLEEYLRCKSATWSSRDMLELIRRKSAAGEAVSPPEGPSTSAASSTRAPQSALSDPGDWVALSAAGSGGVAGSGGALSLPGSRPASTAFAAAAAAAAAAVAAEVVAGQAVEDERSFYGSDSGSSSGGEEEEEGTEGGAGHGGRRQRQRQRRQQREAGSSSPAAEAGDGRQGEEGQTGEQGKDEDDAASGSSGSSDAGSRSYRSPSDLWERGGGPGGGSRRRRSDIGSVLSPEAVSEGEEEGGFAAAFSDVEEEEAEG